MSDSSGQTPEERAAACLPFRWVDGAWGLNARIAAAIREAVEADTERLRAALRQCLAALEKEQSPHSEAAECWAESDRAIEAAKAVLEGQP